MKIARNIGKPMRIGYVVIGLALLVIPFAMGMEGWIRIVFPVLGGVSTVTGALGW